MNQLVRLSLFLASAFLLFTAQKCSEKYRYTQDTMVEISKTACFGRCPVYTFTLYGDGTASFHGKRFVEPEGKHTRTYAADTVNAVFNELIKADLYQYEEEYTEEVTDLPTTYLSFQHEGKEKKIKMYFGFPDELKEIAARLEEVALSEGWKAEEVTK
jgi:hypothetical protein